MDLQFTGDFTGLVQAMTPPSRMTTCCGDESRRNQHTSCTIRVVAAGAQRPQHSRLNHPNGSSKSIGIASIAAGHGRQENDMLHDYPDFGLDGFPARLAGENEQGVISKPLVPRTIFHFLALLRGGSNCGSGRLRSDTLGRKTMARVMRGPLRQLLLPCSWAWANRFRHSPVQRLRTTAGRRYRRHRQSQGRGGRCCLHARETVSS